MSTATGGHAIAALGALVLVGNLAAADAPTRWVEDGDIPLPERAHSVVIVHDDQPLAGEPRGDASRRGSAAEGSRLPLFAARRGSGCAGRWLLVGPLAWVCQSQIELSDLDPSGPASTDPSSDGMPFRYYFVGRGGAQAYARLEFADDASPEMDLQPGFALAIVEERTKGSERYGLTHHGRWVPMRDLAPARVSAFAGQDLPEGALDVAWAFEPSTAVFSNPQLSARARDLPSLPRLAQARVLEEQGAGAKRAYRIDAAHWVRARDVRRPEKQPQPPEVMPNERWIDIDLASQTLVAYAGDRPVFATLVSTGRGAQGTPAATPKGVYRVWVKLRTSTMDNLDDESAQSSYSIEDVPYVQYFSKGVGLHSAFWHEGFGKTHSHGCVNLAPRDAERLFGFTSPRLPAGWSAALPNEYEAGTLIRVR